MASVLEGTAQISTVYACLLPPHSPDFNPIELLRSKVKAYLPRKLGEAKVTLEALLSEAFATVTPPRTTT